MGPRMGLSEKEGASQVSLPSPFLVPVEGKALLRKGMGRLGTTSKFKTKKKNLPWESKHRPQGRSL